jgi:sarcosine oxidase/L-pipecolate oxidase
VIFTVKGGCYADRFHRFLPNAGKYMVNVLDGKGNGEEKDRAFKWKSRTDLEGVDQRQRPNVREWRDLQDEATSSGSAKL